MTSFTAAEQLHAGLLTSTPGRQRSRSNSTSSSCTLDFDHETQIFEIFGDEVIDLTADNGLSDGRIKPGELPLLFARTANSLVKPEDFVEVTDTYLGKYPVEFIRVEVITEKIQPRKVIIRGVPFTRTKNLKGQLPKKLNEVCMLLHHQLEESDSQPSPDQPPMLVEVEPDRILRGRRLVVTNEVWPRFRVTVPKSPQSALLAENTAPLVCRWKMEVYYTLRGRQTRPVEESVHRIHFSEVVDTRYQVSEDILSNRWRGNRIPGGSYLGGRTQKHNLTIDLDTPSIGEQRNSTRLLGQKYTLFDSFAGAGGVSRGAASAGFRIQVNFPTTKLYKMSVDEFITASGSETIRVDVLHLSPPCQYFSPAHTHESIHDDTNIFALFGCSELINRLRPRLITLEQTFGITHHRHFIYFRTLLGDFTQHGYSVRWKVVRLRSWGSFQDRKRLIMIAAAPGERLPPFPGPTHSEDGRGNTKRFATIRQALSTIRPGDDLHNVGQVRHHNPPRAPYDQDQLAMTMTTGGCATNHHPDGTRDFTIREYANLQGFPPTHRFVGNRTSIKRQIGNAFPPNTVRVLYSHLENWLLHEDAIRRYQPPAEDFITLDEDRDVVMSETPSSAYRHTAQDVDEIIEVASHRSFRFWNQIIDLT